MAPGRALRGLIGIAGRQFLPPEKVDGKSGPRRIHPLAGDAGKPTADLVSLHPRSVPVHVPAGILCLDRNPSLICRGAARSPSLVRSRRRRWHHGGSYLPRSLPLPRSGLEKRKGSRLTQTATPLGGRKDRHHRLNGFPNGFGGIPSKNSSTNPPNNTSVFVRRVSLLKNKKNKVKNLTLFTYLCYRN